MKTDPVCGMEVDPKKAAGQSEHEGVIYYFCSIHCKREFDKEPHTYAHAPKHEEDEHAHHYH